MSDLNQITGGKYCSPLRGGDSGLGHRGCLSQGRKRRGAGRQWRARGMGDSVMVMLWPGQKASLTNVGLPDMEGLRLSYRATFLCDDKVRSEGVPRSESFLSGCTGIASRGATQEGVGSSGTGVVGYRANHCVAADH